MKSTNGLTMVRGVIMRKAWKPVNRIKKIIYSKLMMAHSNFSADKVYPA